MIYEKTDVVIVGAGPAGLFAANSLIKRGVRGEDIVIVDGGKRMDQRRCPKTQACNCSTCDIMEGEGGSGGFSDGKNTYSLTRGTQLEQIFDPEDEHLLKDIDDTFLQNGWQGKLSFPLPSAPQEFNGTRFRFDSYLLRHLGSDGIREFIINFTESLRKAGVRIYTRHEVIHLLWTTGGEKAVWGVMAVNSNGEKVSIRARKTFVATGLQGVPWLEEELVSRGGLELGVGPAGIGMRVEAPYKALEPLFERFYDFKLVYESGGMSFRSFCCNRKGWITNENHRTLGVRNVNGHSYLIEPKSNMSNFAIICKVDININPDPQSFVRSIAKSINYLPEDRGHTVAQTLADFLVGIPTNEGREGLSIRTNLQARVGVNIGNALPKQLYDGFASFLRDLGKVVELPLNTTWIYAPEVKYFGRKLPVNFKTWKCEGIKDLYVIGNASGYLDSFVSAALTGVIAARELAGELQTKEEEL